MKMMMNVTQDDGNNLSLEMPQTMISSQEMAKFLVNSLVTKNFIKNEQQQEVIDLIEEKINVRISLENEPCQVHYVGIIANFT